MNLPQCMGGGCLQRDRCAHYFAPKVGMQPPAERLCQRGRDLPVPIKWAPARWPQ